MSLPPILNNFRLCPGYFEHCVVRHWFLFTSSEKDFSLFLKKEVHQEGSDDKSLSHLLGGSNEVTSLFKAFAMLFGSAPHRELVWAFCGSLYQTLLLKAIVSLGVFHLRVSPG